MRRPIFLDRAEAGRRLADRLKKFAARDPVVLALVRGGIEIAEPIARALNAPLDIVLVRKIGAPGHPELALGAVADGSEPQTVINTDLARSMGPLDDYIEREAVRQLGEIERRREAYLGDRSRAEIAGKTAIVVDDGIATGATMRAALRAVRRQRPAHLVLAVPVAPASARADFEDEADEFICLEAPEPFYAVGPCYERFDQVSDDEVVAALNRAADRQSARRN